MKTFMFAVFALVLMFSMAHVAKAQSEAAAIITVSVEEVLVVDPVDGDWGVMGIGNTYVLTPSGFKVPTGPGESAGDQFDPPGFEITGNFNEQVLCRMTFPPGLDNTDGPGGRIALSNWTYGWNADADPTATFQSSGPVVGDQVIAIIGDGVVGIYFGATNTVPITATGGTYEGNLVLSASYVSQ